MASNFWTTTVFWTHWNWVPFFLIVYLRLNSQKNVRGETGCGKTSTISRVIIIIFWSDSPKHDERSRNCNLLSFKILGHNWLWSHSSRFKIVRKRQRLTFFFKAARCLTPAIPVIFFFTPVTLTDQTPNLTDFKTTNTVIDHARNNSQC